MGSKKKQRIGFWYGFGIHMGLCRGPVDEIVEVRVGDRTAWSGSITKSKSVWINKLKLFGGEKKEGGIQGNMEVMMGETSQVIPARDSAAALSGLLNDANGTDLANPAAIRATLGNGALPGFRGTCTVYYDGWVAAMNPYPKKWTFRVRRALKGWQGGTPWYPAKAKILLDGGQIHAMNPAHIIYECVTNREWGRGIPAEFIDETSFSNAADTLYDEKFGLCMRWARKDSIDNFINQVISHIGGAIYTNRMTGLVELKLIRKDYIPNLLPKYTTENGLLQITENTVGTQGNLPNQVVVTYLNPVTNQEGAVRVQSLAGIQAARGSINTLSKTYLGIPTADLALRAAERDLLASCLNLRRFTLVFDRRGYNIVPGSVFRIANPARGLSDIIVRATEVDDGTHLNGNIKVVALQDVFGFPMSSFGGFEPVVPIPVPQPQVAQSQVMEIPYVHLARSMSASDFDYIGPDSGYLGVIAEKPDENHTDYDIAVRSAVPEED